MNPFLGGTTAGLLGHIAGGVTPYGVEPEPRKKFNIQGLLGALLAGSQPGQEDEEEEQQQRLQPGQIMMPNNQFGVSLPAYSRRNPLSGLFG